MKILFRILQEVKRYGFLSSKFVYATGLLFLLSATSVLAQNPPAASGGGAVKLINPLKIDSAETLLTTVLEIVIILATPFIVFFIIYAGFLYVTARGNAEQITQANRALTYAIIGGVIILGSVAIATIVKNIVLAF